MALSVSIQNNRLSFSLGNTQITLHDTIHSGWQHAGDGGNANPAMLAQSGDFDLFTAQSCIEQSAEACIIRTPLCDRETGASLAGASVVTKLCFAETMVQVTLWFEAAQYTPAREFSLLHASADGEAYITMDGDWKALSAEPVSLAGGNYVCRDLREMDAHHPFTAYIALSPQPLPQPAPHTATWDGPVLQSGDLTVGLHRTADGLALVSMQDAKSDAPLFCAKSPEPLFRLLIHHLDTGADEMLESGCGWTAIHEETALDGRVYRFERPGVSVLLTAVLHPEHSRIDWEFDAKLRDPSLTAVRLDPPAVRAAAADDTRLFIALGPGRAVPLSARSELHLISPYPSIGVCMEYMALWREQSRRGIYCGYHDPTANAKTFIADCHDGVAKLETLIPAKGIDEPCNGFAMDGSVVWQLFDGDWYDATLLFREFVHTRSNWFTGVPATERSDVPEWLLKMPVWFQGGSADLDTLFAAHDDLATPLGIHVYSWHQIPFDTNYPHYKPAKETFVYNLPIMQAHGIKVMPYINGRLWDTHDRGDYDYQFSSIAKPHVTKGRGGEVITEHYESRNSKGEHVELGVMCPSTAVWQNKQVEINDWLMNDLQVDAVYVDQIAAAPPILCMDKTHPHRCGGGSWWYDHYRNLIGHLREVAGPEQCYTTESNAEPFTGHIGGMLVWHWTHDHQVPAYSVVYAGYQPMLGRNYGAFQKDDTEAFRIMTAQSLCFGDQLGWLNAGFYLNHPHRDFFRQLVQLRHTYGEYFYAGSCLRPPKLEGDLGKLDHHLHSDGVISAMWQKNADQSRIVVLCNMTEQARTVTVHPDDAEPFTVTLEPTSGMIRPL